MKWLIIILSLFCLTSCIEIIDDLTINSDGSGTFKYNVNLSSSKPEVSAILSIDSIDGYRVPKKWEIIEKINIFKKELALQPGISNVVVDVNWDNYILKFSCDFTSISILQSSIESCFNKISSNEVKTTSDWLTLTNESLVRNIPISTVQFKSSPYINRDMLMDGKYITINRFDKLVKKSENINSQISKNGKAVLVKLNTLDILDFPTMVNNEIFFK